MLRIVAIFVACLLLAACASMERARLAGELRHGRSEVLSTAGSREALITKAAAIADLGARLAEYRLEAFCAIRENHDEWQCRRLRGEVPDGLGMITVTGSRIHASDLITNNQEQAVDEGDIVKKLGDRLYVLRQGRLHTISIGDATAPELRLVDTLVVATDPYGETTWYDEILAAGKLLILLGYNWDEEVAELSVFEAHALGLSHRSRFWLRGSDYFSGTNYGSRIAGEHLLLNLSLPLAQAGELWPEWSSRALGMADEAAAWHSLVEPEAVHLPLVGLPATPSIHVVARCALERLSGGELACEATGLIGSSQTMFYASADAAFLAVSEWHDDAWLEPTFDADYAEYGDDAPRFAPLRQTLVYRMPFRDLDAVQVAAVRGGLGDQFSLKDDGQALLAATTEGRFGARTLLLQRVDWELFGESIDVPPAAVAELRAEAFAIRFSDDALWVGENTSPSSRLLRVSVDDGAVTTRSLPHPGQRIERLGPNMLVIGQVSAGSTLSLVEAGPAMEVRHTLPVPGKVLAETRSHAFNARPDGAGWLFGMPFSDLPIDWEQVSDVGLFSATTTLAPLGLFDMEQAVDCDDHCYDFYGNARIFFVGERVFALSGGLLKEGRVTNGRLVELRTLALDQAPAQ